MTQEILIETIQGIVNKIALHKIEIGMLLNEHKKIVPHGKLAMFYAYIGINERTAQRYISEGKSMKEMTDLICSCKKLKKVKAYSVVGHNRFNYSNCNSSKVLKDEYEALLAEYNDLLALEYSG